MQVEQGEEQQRHRAEQPGSSKQKEPPKQDGKKGKE